MPTTTKTNNNNNNNSGAINVPRSICTDVQVFLHGNISGDNVHLQIYWTMPIYFTKISKIIKKIHFIILIVARDTFISDD